MKLLRMLEIALVVLVAVGAASAQSQWQAVTALPSGFGAAGAMVLLTDGRVLVHDESCNPGTYGNWWTLTPSSTGSYANGTWTQVATMPSGYGPLYFGSAILPDGRYIVEGGEYNNCSADWTNKGAIYDPVANTWTAVSPPSGWSQIGDAASSVLVSGTYMLGSCCVTPPSAALLNASTLTWTATGSGKFDVYDEEGITLLPGGDLIDVDAYVFQYNSAGKNWETYNPNTGDWTSQGSTPEQYWDSAADCGGAGSASYELGPAVLMPNGTLIQTGANSCAAAHNGVYTTSTNSWTEAPDFPTACGYSNLDIADGPAALEVNGNVLMMTSPGIFNTPACFFEWNGSSFNNIAGPPNTSEDSSYYGHMLMLPTGQIMFTDFSNDVELFTSTGSQYSGWQPTALFPNLVFTHGQTYTIYGFKFNGASQDGAYGDDFQDATNYPLIRFTNIATGNVVYGRTHGINAMPVQYQGPSYVQVDVPTNIQTGGTYLQVVVNGIASQNYMIGIN